MTTILQQGPHRPPTTALTLAGQDRERNGQRRLLAEIEQAPAGTDPAAERRRRAEQLAALAGGDRQPLEQLRAGFLRRLHRASDDFAATEGLRTVEMALSMSPRPEGVWPSPPNERNRRRRWWQRWKRPQ